MRPNSVVVVRPDRPGDRANDLAGFVKRLNGPAGVLEGLGEGDENVIHVVPPEEGFIYA